MVNTVTTLVINDTPGEYLLKEGNAGVFSVLATLSSYGGRYPIVCDPNATYREYWVGTNLHGAQTIITSDDCIDCSRIIVRIGSGGVAKTDMIQREVAWTEVVNETEHEYHITELGDGVYTSVGKLKANDGKFTIVGNGSSKKYRVEFRSASGGILDSWDITSEDCVNNKEIVIKRDGPPGKFGTLDKIARAGSASGATKRSLLTKLKRLVGWSHPAT